MDECYKVKCVGYKGLHYIFMDPKGFSLKKKKYIFFGDFIDVNSFLVSDIKQNKSRTLVRIVDKNVDVIFQNDSLNIKFYSYDSAKEFYDKVLELKKNDTFINRSIDKMKNITEDDIRKTVKSVVKATSIIGILVHGVKSVVKDGKGVLEEGKEVVKSIFKK